MPGFEIRRAGRVFKRPTGPCENHPALLKMPDCGGHPTLTEVTRVVIRGVIEIETEPPHIVEHGGIGHRPGSAGRCGRGSLTPMKGHLKISEPHIMIPDQFAKLLKAIVSVL